MKQKLLLLFTVLFVLNLSSQTFDGEAGNSWNEPMNWSGNEVPLPTGNVIIPNGFDVVAPAAININSLQIQGASTLTTNNNLVFSSTISIDSDATLNWNGGALAGLGGIPLTFINNGTINIFGLLQMSVVNMTNNGIIDFQSGLQFSINAESTLTNSNVGTIQFSVPGTENFNPGGGPSNIINNGTLRVAHQNTNEVSAIGSRFENNNLIIVENGTLRLYSNLVQLNSGTMNIASDGVLLIDNNITMDGTINGIVDGQINWDDAINLIGNLSFDFNGNGSIEANLAELEGNGTMTSNFEININNSLFMTDTAELVNEGEIYLQEGSTVTMTMNSRMVNSSIGVVEFLGNNSAFAVSSPNTMFENFGPILASLPNFTDEARIECNFTNQNSDILVDSGTLRIGRFGVPSATLNSGIYDIDPDGILSFGEVFINGNLLGEIDGDLNWLEDIYVTGQSNFQFNKDLGQIYFDGATVRGGGVLINETGIDVLGNSFSNILDMTTLENEGDINFLEDGNIRIGVDCNLINRLNGMIYFEGDNSGIGRFGTGNNNLENYGEISTVEQNINVRIGAETTNFGIIAVSDSEFWFDNVLVNTEQGAITGDNGTIRLPSVAANFSNEGIYSTGFDISAFTLINQYSSTPTATWVVNIQGNQQGITYDYTEIQGNAAFNGDLFITVVDYSPTIGEEFIIATTTGTILECNYPASIAVPEGPGIFQEFLVECRNNNEVVLTYNGALSTNEFESVQAKIYPVPFNDQLSIVLNKSEQIKKVSLVDINGKVVFERNPNEPSNILNLDLFDLSSGVYFLNIITENNMSVWKKVLKQ